MNGCLKRIGQGVGVLALLALVVVVVAVATAPGDGAPATVTPTATSAPLPTVTPGPTPTATIAWYAGGTLHNATVGEWRAADERNKLATAADWAARGWDSVANLEQNARDIVTCVDEAAPTFKDTESAANLAAACVIFMKGQ